MSCLSVWLLAATLGQAPAADGSLDVVPAEADVVIRVRGVEPARDDLLAMIKAMSPALAEQAGPALEQGVVQFRGHAGEQGSKLPFLGLVRAVKPDNPGAPPFAILVKSTSYEGVLQGAAGGKAPDLKHEEGGVDSFAGQDGQTWYAAKGPGVVAFGPDKVLISAIAKPGSKTLGKTLSPALQSRLFSGDLGLYVNVAALSGRYGEELDQAKQGLMAALDQAGQQGGPAASMMDMAKSMYAGLFDSIKEADALALSLDFAAEGATLDGALAVKPDSKVAKAIAGAKAGDAALLAKLSADAGYFIYMNLDPKSFEAVQKLGLGMMSPGGKPTPELEAAVAKQREQGRVEVVTGMTIGKGMKAFNLYNVSDPKALLATNEAMMNGLKNSDTPLNIYKDVTITRDAESYGGFKFCRVELTVDPDKLAKLSAGNPAAAEQMKTMIGGDKITSWFGVNDTQMLQLTAPNWDQAKAQIDAFQKGEGTLGAAPGFASARAKMPRDVNVLVFLSAQGILRQVSAQFGAPNAPDMPKEPALIGASLTTNPGTGFEFRLVVPSSVGPVFEKGMPRGAAAPGNP